MHMNSYFKQYGIPQSVQNLKKKSNQILQGLSDY